MKKILFIVTAIFISGCYKDLGNYTYKEINDITIGNIAPQYTMMFRDTLRIKPELSFLLDKGDTGKYEYEWTIFFLDDVSETNSKVIATTRDLEYDVTAKVGKYKAWLRVKDRSTGVQYKSEFRLTIQSKVYEGWLVLSDVNGMARLDMVSVLPAPIGETLITDLLKFTNAGLPPQKGPRSLKVMNDPFKNKTALYLMTDDGANKLNGDDFTWTTTGAIRYEMLGPAPEGFAPRIMDNATGTYCMLSDDQLYTQYPTFGLGYGLPQNKAAGTNAPIKLAPFVGKANSTLSTWVVFYDVERRWFLRLDGTKEAGCDSIPTPANALTSYKTGKDLVYMQNATFNQNDIFTILKDPGQPNYYLFRMSVDGYPSVFRQNQFTQINQSTGDIAHARKFAVGNELGYVLYSVGSKIYEYDINYNTHHLMADLGTEVISKLKVLNLGTTKYKDITNSLIVGSYDPAGPEGSNGKLRIYTMPPRNEPFQLYKFYTGFGKVTDMEYRTR
jgi:hypothetical protein